MNVLNGDTGEKNERGDMIFPKIVHALLEQGNENVEQKNIGNRKEYNSQDEGYC